MPRSQWKKCILLFCVLVMATAISTPACFAMNTGFDVNDKPEEDALEIFSHLNLELIEEPKITTGFSCFDANASGDYLLGFDLLEKDVILAYNSEGTYLYGFSLADGGAFGIEWDGNDIIVYRVRSNLAILIDKQGKCLDIKEIQDTSKNNDYWRNDVNANKRIVGDATFTAEHWLFNSEYLHWGEYPRLIKTSSTGETVILFDNTSHTFSTIISIIGLISASCLLVAIVVLIRRRINKSKA